MADDLWIPDTHPLEGWHLPRIGIGALLAAGAGLAAVGPGPLEPSLLAAPVAVLAAAFAAWHVVRRARRSAGYDVDRDARELLFVVRDGGTEESTVVAPGDDLLAVTVHAHDPEVPGRRSGPLHVVAIASRSQGIVPLGVGSQDFDGVKDMAESYAAALGVPFVSAPPNHAAQLTVAGERRVQHQRLRE